MRKLASIVLWFGLSALGVAAQGVSVQGQAVVNTTTSVSGIPGNSVLQAVPGATITVCSSVGGGIPCSPLVTIYSNAALSVVLANPFTADANGNFQFFVAPNTTGYLYSVTGATITGQLYQILPQTNAGSSIVGTISIAAGQTALGSGVNTISGGTIVLDMKGISGADLGAIMNTCAGQLPAAGGTCKGDNLTGVQTISTAVTTSKAVTYTFSGQAINQAAAVTFASGSSGIDSCSGTPPTFTKAASLDQFTLSAANTFLRCVNLNGAKASFTGNGAVTASGASNVQISGNVISAEANDDIKDNSGTFSVNNISKNWLFSWGLHAFESTSTSQQSLFADNYALGDGTATGAAILNGGSDALRGNYIKDSNGVLLVDDSTAAQEHPVVGNRFTQTNGWPGFKTGGGTTATGNTVSAGGSHGPGVQVGQGNFSSNTVNSTNADAIDITANASQVVSNITNVSIASAQSGVCVINVINDNLLNVIADNFVGIGDNNNGDLNYGVCLTATSGHMLENSVHDNLFDAVLSGGAQADGFYFNNTAGLNTNTGGNSWVNNKCIHELPACLKRVDAFNAANFYQNNMNDTGTLFDGTGGSGADVLDYTTATVTFAQLPTAGPGSRLVCSNCGIGAPVPGVGGGGGVIYKLQSGVWSSSPDGVWTTTLDAAYTNSTTSFTNVTGSSISLAFAVPANNLSYTGNCTLFYQSAATGGLNIEFTTPAAPTQIVYDLNEPLSAGTFNDAVATAASTSLGAVVTTAATNFGAQVHLQYKNGSTAGTVQMLAKSSAAVQLTIQPGSFCQWQQQ